MTKPVLWLAIASLLSLIVSLLPLNESHASPQPLPLNNAYDLIAEVNALRASRGLPAYNVNSILMQIAQAHSDYQASIGTVTHYSADGSRPFQRALAAGYPLAGDLSGGGFFSENIVSGSGLTSAGAVAIWMGDSPHQYTMLSPNLQDVGAGVSTAGGVTYYTLDAGSSTGSTIEYTPPSGNATSLPGTPAGQGTSEIVQPVITATPLEDGAVYHEVQAGQALWSIALAYNTTIEELKRLNKLVDNEIFVGQKLLVRQDNPVTPTAEEPTATVTIGVPVSTATLKFTPTVTPTSTPEPAPPATRQSTGLAVGVIILGALLAAGLGTWLSTKKPL